MEFLVRICYKLAKCHYKLSVKWLSASDVKKAAGSVNEAAQYMAYVLAETGRAFFVAHESKITELQTSI